MSCLVLQLSLAGVGDETQPEAAEHRALANDLPRAHDRAPRIAVPEPRLHRLAALGGALGLERDHALPLGRGAVPRLDLDTANVQVALGADAGTRRRSMVAALVRETHRAHGLLSPRRKVEVDDLRRRKEGVVISRRKRKRVEVVWQVTGAAVHILERHELVLHKRHEDEDVLGVGRPAESRVDLDVSAVGGSLTILTTRSPRRIRLLAPHFSSSRHDASAPSLDGHRATRSEMGTKTRKIGARPVMYGGGRSKASSIRIDCVGESQRRCTGELEPLPLTPMSERFDELLVRDERAPRREPPMGGGAGSVSSERVLDMAPLWWATEPDWAVMIEPGRLPLGAPLPEGLSDELSP